jgi:hypothetical protein
LNYLLAISLTHSVINHTIFYFCYTYHSFHQSASAEEPKKAVGEESKAEPLLLNQVPLSPVEADLDLSFLYLAVKHKETVHFTLDAEQQEALDAEKSAEGECSDKANKLSAKDITDDIKNEANKDVTDKVNVEEGAAEKVESEKLKCSN